jgi:hypothetical protein
LSPIPLYIDTIKYVQFNSVTIPSLSTHFHFDLIQERQLLHPPFNILNTWFTLLVERMNLFTITEHKIMYFETYHIIHVVPQTYRSGNTLKCSPLLCPVQKENKEKFKLVYQYWTTSYTDDYILHKILLNVGWCVAVLYTDFVMLKPNKEFIEQFFFFFNVLMFIYLLTLQ